jgi:hypothetical protein
MTNGARKVSLAASLAALVAVGSAAADPTVFIDPPFKLAQVGDIFSVDIALDASGDSVGCFNIYLDYSSSIVELRSATEGLLFRNSGFPTFFGWFHNGPVDTVLDCVLGFRTFVIGPGEMVNLEFRALANGQTPVHFLYLDLRDIDRNPFSNAMAVDGIIQVGGSGAVGGDEAGAGGIPLLAVAPNPTAGGATASFRLGRAGPVRATIFDAAGRTIRSFDPGWLAAGQHEVTWDGRAESGRPVPPGVYWLALAGPDLGASARVVTIH